MDNSLEKVEDKLLFMKGVLCLFKETELFGVVVEKALDDVDFIAIHVHRLRGQ